MLRTAWANLPVLLLGSVPVAVVWVAVRALPPAFGWLALAGVGLVLLPALAALVHGCTLLLAGEDFGPTALVPTLVRTYPAAVGVTALPTASAVLTLLALHVWRLSHQPWVLASIGAGLAVSVVAGLVAVVAVPYRVATRAPLRETWLVSCFVVTRNLVPVLAVASAVGLAVWAASHLSFALVLLLPAPLALVWASAYSSATRRSQDHLAALASPRS